MPVGRPIAYFQFHIFYQEYADLLFVLSVLLEFYQLLIFPPFGSIFYWRRVWGLLFDRIFGKFSTPLHDFATIEQVLLPLPTIDFY